MEPLNPYIAIDPMALILNGRALDIWYLIHHPHDPAVVREIEDLVRRMNPDDRSFALARARSLAEVAHAVEQAVEAVAKTSSVPSSGAALSGGA